MTDDGPDLPLSYVNVPPEEPTDGPDPAVVVLHGRGADEEDLLPVARHLPGRLRVLSLRGPERLQRGYTWYDIEMPDGDLHRSRPDPTGYRRSLDLVAESVAAAVEGFDIDPARVGLLGFSMGSMLTMGLLLEAPGEYAWGVALHGYLPRSHADLAPEGIDGKPVFVGGGTRDQVIPAERVTAAADRFRELGADVTHDLYPAGHGVGEAELADVVSFVEARLG